MPETTTPGPKALQQMHDAQQHKPFHLLLIDTILDTEKNLEFAKTVREDHPYRHLPILIMTTVGKIEEPEPLPGDAVISKPVKTDTLYRTIIHMFGQTPEADENKNIEKQDANFAGVHLLLAEDTETNQIVTATILQQHGITVDIAANGFEAVQLAKTNQYDAVLMDVQMPKMDGYEAPRQIRTQPELTDLPIISMTAGAMLGDREKCIEAGMNDYLSKPVNSDMLLATLRKHIRPASLPATSSAPSPLPSGIPSTLPGLEISRAFGKMGNNWELYFASATSFPEFYSDSPEQIEKALTANDYKSAQRIAHTIKGLSANFGMVNILATAKSLELMIREQKTLHDITPMLSQLHNNLHEIKTTIEELARLSPAELPNTSTGQNGATVTPPSPPQNIRPWQS